MAVKITIEVDGADPHLGDRLQAILQGIFEASGGDQDKSDSADKHIAAKALGITVTKLRDLRLSGALHEGIHYSRISPQTIRYNLPMLKDWWVNRNDPAAHQRAINHHLRSLPSNQKSKSGR
jgi:hypothetical protein